MNQFPNPLSPIQTIRPTSESSSPPSSRTTSPPSSPTSTFRHRSRTTSRSLTSPHHLFNLSFQPHHSSQSQDHHSNSSTCEHHVVSILPCAVLRGRSSLMVVRRRPSAVDMALSEERSRCDGDAIERAGLDLMEPRPVEMERETRMAMNMNAGMGMGVNMGASVTSHGSGGSTTPNEEKRGSILRPQQSPRFVMGGIFEVMEGRA